MIAEPEDERVRYGLTKNVHTFNPFRVFAHEWVAIWRDLRAASNWRDRAGFLLRGPGWEPADDPDQPTSAIGTTGQARSTTSSLP